MLDEETYEQKVKRFDLNSLLDVKHHIDREKYPDRYKLVLAEIEERKRELEHEVKEPKATYDLFIPRERKVEMRRLFIVCAKLLGVLVMYWGLLVIPELAIAYGNLTRETSAAAIPLHPEWIIIGLSIAFLIPVSIGIILAFKTDYVAQILKLPDDAKDLPIPHALPILSVGLLLIGIYLLVQGLPPLVVSVMQGFQYVSGFTYPWVMSEFIASLLQILMGISLFLYRNRIAHFFLRRYEET